MTSLQFHPFVSSVDTSFWHRLAELKLDKYKSSDAPIPIHGYYSSGSLHNLPPRLFLGRESFDEQMSPPPQHFSCPGTLLNTNTFNDFKKCDKGAMLQSTAAQIWEAMTNEEALSDPSLLFRFNLLTFADLKTYCFSYWFAFPALCLPALASLEERPMALPTSPLSHAAEHLAGMSQCVHLYDAACDAPLQPLTRLDEYLRRGCGDDAPLTIVIADPCPLPTHPAWPLRNVLALIARRWRLCHPGDQAASIPLRVICYRATEPEKSLYLSLRCPLFTSDDVPKAVGWEKNSKGKLLPRTVDLAEYMDPARLAETSVDLNLKLMRWRLLPSLDLERLKATRCLLLGAGTLGTYVARALMAWGVRTITLVDRGRVSFSNPVRQSLFCFEDCLEGGKYKAEAAAKELRRIFPGANTTAHRLTIPMPGHPVQAKDRDAIRADVSKLDELIQTHDVVYILTDTRESRWLPTMLAAHHGKLVMNAALGFDSFVVMRHGVFPRDDEPEPATPGAESPATATTTTTTTTATEARDPTLPRLANVGCYFCSDVVAPRNSTRDRTLDEQCTVTRPGLALVSSALAVELMAAVLHHPMGPRAPADCPKGVFDATQQPMGFAPHQIRGFLTHFHNTTVHCPAYPQCTACSPKIVQAYRQGGFDFLLRAFNEPDTLEELTGLAEMQRQMEAMADQYEPVPAGEGDESDDDFDIL